MELGSAHGAAAQAEQVHMELRISGMDETLRGEEVCTANEKLVSEWCVHRQGELLRIEVASVVRLGLGVVQRPRRV